MVLAIDLLRPGARRLLETGACIGHQFELSMLAELTDLSLEAVTVQLWPAIEDGLLVSTNDSYKPSLYLSTFDNSTNSIQATLRFAHDRVQQAAYGLLSEQDRQALHHAIGRRLLDRAGDDFDEHLFEIVDQLNLGQAQVVDDAERRSLVELNLAAGRKAKASATYRAAFEYLTVARRYLGDGAWDKRPMLQRTASSHNRRFGSRNSRVRTIEAFRAVFHHGEDCRNGPGSLGLQQHRGQTPRVDPREEQYES